MQVTKKTDKYTLLKDGSNYILNLGQIKKGDDTTTVLLFEGFTDLNLKGGCSCVTKTKKEIGNGDVEYTIKYTLCEKTITKTLTCNKNNITIKIIGSCT